MRDRLISWLRHVLIAANIFAAIALLGSYTSVYIGPRQFWPSYFLGLGYPYLFLVNCLFALLWMIWRWPWALISGLVIVLGLVPLSRFLSVPYYSNSSTDDIRVMTFNVKRFYPADHAKSDQVGKEYLHDIMIEHQPKILCIQENSLSKQIRTRQAARMRQEVGLDYHHYRGGGLAIYSAFPIIESGTIDIANNWTNGLIWADLVLEQDTIRVMNMHLASIALGTEHEELVNEVLDDEIEAASPRNRKDRVRNIARKLRRASYKRQDQAEALGRIIDSSPHPVLLCGDLNDTPHSYAYGQINRRLDDAWPSRGAGIGATHIGRIPMLRIDYIFGSKRIDFGDAGVVSGSTSDHAPLVATFSLAAE